MLKRALIALVLGLLSGPAFAQAPSPGKLGLVVATPNVVQVLDTTKTWSTIGTINPVTHLFTPSGGAGISDAPNDATLYGRKSLAWSHLTHNDITDWAASIPPVYTLPVASTTVLGGVKVDGTTITATGGGVISAAIPPATPPGGTSGQIQFNSGGSAFGGFTASGDATINTSTGAVAVTKTGGTAFGALATVAPGTGVATALGVNTNASGGMALVNGSPVVGNALKWSAAGVQDGGALPSTTTQRFLALASLTSATPVCAPNGCTPTGTGYSGASGTLTLTTNGGKIVCSTYPVLNATLTGGNITAATINTAGSCTIMGNTFDEVWTPGGSLVGGSGALFALTWTATPQTYTPTAGTKNALVFAYGAGAQGGGGASTVAAGSGGAGGGGGSVNQCLASAAQIGGSQTVTVGLGGRSGGSPSAVATGSGVAGQAGGVTTLGALCKGWGGGAGFGGNTAIAGGGAGAGIATQGANGTTSSAPGVQCGSGGSTTFACNGGGAGGGQSAATGAPSNGSGAVGGGAGGGSAGGLSATPSATFGGLGGVGVSNGFPITGGTNGGGANVSGSAGNNPSNPSAYSECGAGGGGAGSGLTTTVAGNGGAGGLCSGGAGGGSVVNGAGSAPGFGAAGGDGVLDVVEFH